MVSKPTVTKDIACMHLKTVSHGIESIKLLYGLLEYERIDNKINTPEDLELKVLTDILNVQSDLTDLRRKLGCEIK